MAVDKDYTRLGLFLALATVVVLGTALFFLQRVRDRPVLEAVTYTDESVTGLDVSSLVRFKGVQVGRVQGIRVDPESRLVEIDFEMFLDRLANLGADLDEVQRASDIGVIEDFRASIVGNPVTGEAYLLIDTPPTPPPAIELGFTPARLRIPSTRSAFSDVRDRLPSLIERGEALAVQLEQIVARLPETLDRGDRFFETADRVLVESDVPALSAEARAFFANASEDVERLTEELSPLLGEDGALTAMLTSMEESELPAASAAMMDETALAMSDLRRSLPAIREGLQQLRMLTRMLEEQPEAMVYGPRARGGGEP
jgi:paraquat-inducible protein B